MSKITFVFGPRDSFFFDCPQAWKFHGIPATLRQLFNSSMGPAWRITQPYCVGLAPQGSAAEPLWYVGCKVLNGEGKIFYSQNHFDTTYPDLSAWTKSLPDAPRSCFVTFGQNLSYFVSAPGHGSVWAGIPSELEDRIRKARDTPTCVSLGMKGAWFVLFPGGEMAWKLQGCYGQLEKILAGAAMGSVTYVAISPYSKEQYFVAFADRTVKYNFKGAPAEWMKLMTEVFDAWAVERLYVQQQLSKPYAQNYPHQPIQPYPQVQPYPQTHYPQSHSPYNVSPQPAKILMSPPLTPNTPLPMYTSPDIQHARVNSVNQYLAPQPRAIEMPAELPGNLLLSAPAPIPVRPVSSEKRKSFFSKLF